MTARSKSLVLLLVKLLVAAALIALVASSEKMRNVDWHGLVASIARWHYLVAAFLMVCTIPLIGAVRWHMLLGCLGYSIPFWRTLHLTLTGMFFNCIGMGYAAGDVAKGYYVTRGQAPGRKAEVVYALVFDRAVGFFSLLLLGSLVMLANLSEVWNDRLVRIAAQVIGVAVGVLLFGFMLIRPGIMPGEADSAPADEGTARAGLLLRLYLSLKAYRASYVVTLAAVALSLLAHAVTVGVLFLLGRALGMHPIGIPRFVFYVVVGIAFSSAGPLMGVGFGQFAFAELFKHEWPEDGYQFGVILATVYQLTVLSCNVLLGLPAFLGLRGKTARVGGDARDSGQPDQPFDPGGQVSETDAS